MHDVQVRTARADGLRSRLESLSPRDTLRRGYAIVQTEADSPVVTDSTQVNAGDSVQVTLARGGFDAEVTSVGAEDEGGKVSAHRQDGVGSKL